MLCLNQVGLLDTCLILRVNTRGVMLHWRYWTDWPRLIVPNGLVCFNDNVSTNPYQAWPHCFSRLFNVNNVNCREGESRAMTADTDGPSYFSLFMKIKTSTKQISVSTVSCLPSHTIPEIRFWITNDEFSQWWTVSCVIWYYSNQWTRRAEAVRRHRQKQLLPNLAEFKYQGRNHVNRTIVLGNNDWKIYSPLSLNDLERRQALPDNISLG